MENYAKYAFSVISGALAAFMGQYGLFLGLVVIAIVIDVITGLIKAKATGEGLSSERATRGFWRKISLLVGLGFGIFLDFAVNNVLTRAGISLGAEMPIALMICAYIIINEAISISENLYLTNPDSFPRWLAKRLKVAKEQMERGENSDFDK